MFDNHLPELIGCEILLGLLVNAIQEILAPMPEYGPSYFCSGASGLYRTVLAGFRITIIVTENLIMTLSGSVIGELMTGRTEIAIIVRVIAKAIGIKILIPGTIGIGLFGNLDGHSLLATEL
jgi:hypothetical protein